MSAPVEATTSPSCDASISILPAKCNRENVMHNNGSTEPSYPITAYQMPWRAHPTTARLHGTCEMGQATHAPSIKIVPCWDSQSEDLHFLAKCPVFPHFQHARPVLAFCGLPCDDAAPSLLEALPPPD